MQSRLGIQARAKLSRNARGPPKPAKRCRWSQDHSKYKRTRPAPCGTTKNTRSQRGAHAVLEHGVRGDGRPELPARSNGHVEAQIANHERSSEVFRERDGTCRGRDYLHRAARCQVAATGSLERLGDHRVEPESVAPQFLDPWRDTLIRPVM